MTFRIQPEQMRSHLSTTGATLATCLVALLLTSCGGGSDGVPVANQVGGTTAAVAPTGQLTNGAATNPNLQTSAPPGQSGLPAASPPVAIAVATQQAAAGTSPATPSSASPDAAPRSTPLPPNSAAVPGTTPPGLVVNEFALDALATESAAGTPGTASSGTTSSSSGATVVPPQTTETPVRTAAVDIALQNPAVDANGQSALFDVDPGTSNVSAPTATAPGTPEVVINPKFQTVGNPLGQMAGAPAIKGPYYIPAGGAIYADETSMTDFTEAQWLDIVPTQAGHNVGVECPTNPTAGFSWNPRKPNEITCDGKTYSIAASTNDPGRHYASYNVLSGKVMQIPYWIKYDGKQSNVGMRIDYEKRIYLYRHLKKLAMAYRKTHDRAIARRITATLDRWANHVPDYVVVYNNSQNIIINVATAGGYRGAMRFSDYNGAAHEWYQDIIDVLDAVYHEPDAWSEINAARGYDVRKHVADDFYLDELKYMFNVLGVNTLIGSNLVGELDGAVKVATILGRLDVIGEVVRAQQINKSYLLRDGMYPQSFSYGLVYLQTNLAISGNIAKFFSIWPPTTADSKQVYADSQATRDLFQKGVASIASVRLPGNINPPFGNSVALGIGSGPIEGHSAYMPGFGHVAMGAGTGAATTQVNFALNDHALHLDHDLLSYTLVAEKTELIGDIKYSRIPGRNWTQSVFAHNTVAVDRSDQHRGGNEEPGNNGHIYTPGDILTYEPGLAGIAIAEADGSRAYANKGVQRYQRLLMYNASDVAQPYLIDLFRVTGGMVHDYLLHGSTAFDQTAPPPSGTLSGTTTAPFVRMAGSHPLLEGTERFLADGSGPSQYGVFADVYTMPLATNGAFDVAFNQVGGTAGSRIFVLNTGNTDAYLGKGPSPFRSAMPSSSNIADFTKYWRPMMMLRNRSGGALDSLFATVVEPYTTRSSITSVRRLPLKTAENRDKVAIEITFASGRVDTVLINMNRQDPAPEIATADGKFISNAHVASYTASGTDKKSFMLSGTSFRNPATTLTKSVGSYAGTITAMGGSATSYSFTANVPLPAGTALQGKWIRLTYNHGANKNLTQMYQIDRVETAGSQSTIFLTEDPGVTMQAGVARETIRPRRQFDGAVRFNLDLSFSQ